MPNDARAPAAAAQPAPKHDPSHDALVNLFASAQLDAPELLPPARFVERTSIRFKMRSSDTKAVDVAYEAFYRQHRVSHGAPRSRPMIVAATNLYEALEALRKAKGGDWSLVTRNVASDGLLADLHAYLGSRWIDEIEAASARERGAVAWDIKRSRFGVVYLLGNTKISQDWAPIALEGIAELGAAGAFIGMNAAGKSVSAATETVVGPLRATTVTAGGQAALRGARGIVAEPSKFTERMEGISKSRRIEGPGFYVPTFPATRDIFEEIAKKPIEGVDDVVGLVVGGSIGVGAAIAIDTVVETIRTIGQNLLQAVIEFINLIRDKCFKDDLAAARVTGATAKAIACVVVAEVAKAAAPFVGGFSKLGTGLAQCVKAATEKTALWLDRRRVTLLEGHFSLISESIEWQVTKGMLHGLWTMLKGAGDIAMNAFLPGAGSLVSVLMTALEWVARFIVRLVEAGRIDTFLTEAKSLWTIERALATPVEVEGPDGPITRYEPNPQDGGGIIHNPTRFKAFFQRGCDASVTIPMLTLNSGICGSIYEQIEILSGDRRISQSQFDAGVSYFRRLKRISSAYLRSSGMCFSGANESVDGLVRMAVREHGGRSGFGMKVLTGLAT